MNWLAGFAASVLQKLLPWVLTKLMDYFKNKQKTSDDNKTVDEKLDAFKKAYEKAFDGTPMTPEQEKGLRDAIRDFIRA